MLFLAIILVGVIGYLRLPIDLLPDVAYPRLVVYSSYPDVAPAEVERQVTRRIESAVSSVGGIETVTSTTREGTALVTMRFAWGTDMDFALLNSREALDQVNDQLPESATRPQILRVDPQSEPIMTLSVTGPGSLWLTKQLTEAVFKRRLEQLDGVAEAAVTGGLDREIFVILDPALQEAYGISFGQITAALTASNYSTRGGTILQANRRFPIRIVGEFEDPSEIEDVIVVQQTSTAPVAGSGTSTVSGRIVRLKDIARVVDGFSEREVITYYNGEEAVGMLVFKESGTNTVDVAERVEDVVAQLNEDYGIQGMQVVVASSQAGFISDSITNVVQALLFGGILAFLVLFLFLRDPKYPVAIATAIPISVIGTFALMEAAGVSLNIMSLGGLALGVGMLVDNSIVVLENVFRHREMGKKMLEAAAIGAEEVQGAITASTLTTISVFAPIIYVEGIAGELFGDLSFSVAFSLIASLLVALTLLPTMAARFVFREEGREILGVEEEKRPATGTRRILKWVALAAVFAGAVWSTNWLVEDEQFFFAIGPGAVAVIILFYVGIPQAIVRQIWGALGMAFGGVGAVLGTVFRPFLNAFDAGFEVFAGWYHRVLEGSLNNRFLVMALSIGSLVAVGFLGATLERDLLPDVDQGSFNVRITLQQGTPLEGTAEVATAIDEAVRGTEGVLDVFTRVGKDVRALAGGEDDAGVHTAMLTVRLIPGVPTDQVLNAVRPIANEYPFGTVAFETGQATALGAMLGSVDADVSVRIKGEELDIGFGLARQVQDILAQNPNLGNVHLGVEEEQRQITIRINSERVAQYGLQDQAVASLIDESNRGALATEFVDFDRKIPVTLQLPNEMRYDLANLKLLRIQGVPVGELIEVKDTVGAAEIHRESQSRVVTVYADVIQGGLDQAVAEINDAILPLKLSLPEDFTLDVGGENEEMRKSFLNLAFAFGLALVLVYMILAAQFESFVHPLTIMIAVPLALIGALLGLWVAGAGLNTMSLIGVVILVGIVVNDAIVKVDFINQMRASGMAVRQAILEAGKVRLRPIIMTTVTTVFGLLPMAMGIGRGADLRAPLAIAVIGGLSVATVLTLIVVPVVYSLIESMRGLVIKDVDDGSSPASEASVAT